MEKVRVFICNAQNTNQPGKLIPVRPAMHADQK